MKKAKNKLILAISELLIVVLLFSGATFAFFQITTTTQIGEVHLRVQTFSELLVRNMDDPYDTLGNELTFNLDEEDESIYDEVTTVDGINFFYEFYDTSVEEGQGYLIRNFAFWAPINLDVYLSEPESGEVFETSETDEEKLAVIDVLRVGFIPFVFVDDGEGGEEEEFMGPPIPIHARIREETFVSQDPNYQEDTKEITTNGETETIDGKYVDNFTTLGSGEGGQPLFSVEGGEEKFVRIVIWVEGNDPDSTALIAEADFSVNLQFRGVESL